MSAGEGSEIGERGETGEIGRESCLVSFESSPISRDRRTISTIPSRRGTLTPAHTNLSGSTQPHEPMLNFRDLHIWQDSVRLSVAIYELTESFPPEERNGLSDQLKRASVSVSSNIAEGKGRGTFPDLRHFLRIARGSVNEVESQIEVAIALGFVERRRVEPTIILSGMIAKGITKLISFGERRR